MSETESKAVAAATELFSHYGFKRTSMAAVAEKAGLSRQTLYATFNNKDQLLAAAMSTLISKIIADMESDWQECTSVDQILTVYFKHAVYVPFELLKKAPDIIDLIHGVADETAKVACKSEDEKTRLLAKQLEPYSKHLDQVNSDVSSVAKFIVMTSNELKYAVTSRRTVPQSVSR